MKESKRTKGAAGTPATVAATRAGIGFTLHPYEVDHPVRGSARSATASAPARSSVDAAAESYGEAAAKALGVPPERLFKTLLAEVDGNLTVGVVPVSGRLDLKALAAAVGGKRARMAEPADAERATGYVVGGISPLGQRRRLPVVVDESASGFPTVYVSAGRRGLQIELAPADLLRLTGARTALIGGA